MTEFFDRVPVSTLWTFLILVGISLACAILADRAGGRPGPNPSDDDRRWRQSHGLTQRSLLRFVAAFSAILAILSLFWGIRASHQPADQPAPSVTTTSAELPSSERIVSSAADARHALDALEVSDIPAPIGYDRATQFGPWADPDRNGCDARNDTLGRDLRDVTTDPKTRGCVVTSGVLDDPYTGTRMGFTRGNKTSSLIHIDHVVALKNAWDTGAHAWDEAKRVAFANDPLNLVAVNGRANTAKGDKDASRWLPDYTPNQCPYAARQIAVKAAYGLAVSSKEKAALAEVLSGCPKTIPALTKEN